MIEILGKGLGAGRPTYFVADIAANHDGSLERAKHLIREAAASGADAAKFQHFAATTIVSDVGFRALGAAQSHQASWKKSVFEVYKDASISMDWTPQLRDTCSEAGIAFLTSPYSVELVDHVDPYVPAYKIGSGDITWIEMIEYIAGKGKPVMLATGAADIADVQRAVSAALRINRQLILMQCNTNYTGDASNFGYIQLNVLRTYGAMYPDLILGLSDHTPGHVTVLGAVALGARVVEKHFTDDTSRNGPDHKFSMSPATWREMVERVRDLEAALGAGVKKVEENERETVVLQRRAVRLGVDVPAGAVLTSQDIVALRPCPLGALPPYTLPEILGRRTRRAMKAGEHIQWTDLE